MLVWEKPCNCNLECAHTLETLIRATGPEYCSAFIAEPVVGATLGTVSAPERYFQIIRDIYNRYGILFIADEVKTGLGRTGKRWGLEHWEVKPDIIATAKALSSGYLSLGATIASDDIYEVFGEPFAHGHTYGSHPVACAAGAATLDYLIRNKLVERSAKLGGYLHERLQDLYDLQSVGDIRGLGLFVGVELVEDKESKKPFTPDTLYHRRVVNRCFENKLLVYPGSGTVDGVRGTINRLLLH